MVGVQEDMKVFCVREDGAELFDGSGPKQKEEEANLCVVELLYLGIQSNCLALNLLMKVPPFNRRIVELKS